VNVSVRWLEDFLRRPLEAADVAERLTMLGAPVDAIEPLHTGLGDIVVALVEDVRPHPNADRLRLCTVNDGAPERHNVVYASYQELAGHPLVYDMLERHVAEVNSSLADEKAMAGAQIRRFLILHKELDADDGELTRTRKVRRGAIADKYGVLIDALYAGKTTQFIETAVKFEDGRSGSVSADLKIVDVKTFPAVRRAA